MSASLIGWIWAQELSSTAKLVLFALNEHTNIGEHGDWRVFPSQERIAKMCAVSKPTVIKAMKELTEAGVITVAHQHDNKGRQLQNLYWLQAPKLLEEGGLRNLTPQLKNDTHGGKETLHKPLNKNPFNKTLKRFIPPTVAEVADYCKERSNSVNPNHFVDHYEANGWMRGKTKVKCWKACVRTWEKNSKSEGAANYL